MILVYLRLIPNDQGLSIIKFFTPINANKVFRSPSRMAISRSYPRHLVQFCEENKKHFTSYFSFASFFKKTQLFIKMNYFFCIELSARVIRLGYPPRLSTQVVRPGYLSSYLMLPNLTNHFIKLSDSDLQCE